MEKFNRTLRGYDPIEVNQFLDHVIKQVEKMVDDIKEKDARIAELQAMEEGHKHFGQGVHEEQQAFVLLPPLPLGALLVGQ